MAFNKIIKDMNIIAALDDEPNDVGGLSAAQLKAKFDEGGLALKTFINSWIDAIAAGTAAANIGAEDLNGVATDLQTALDNLAESVIGTLPDGSVTTAKLHDGAVTDAKVDWTTSEILRIETQSYVGTGTYGDKANATVITFQHEPKIFFITPCSGSWTNYSRDEAWFDWEALKTAWNNRGSAAYASTRYQNVDNTYYYELRFEISGNTIYLWTANYDTAQYNNENDTYRVTSIY